MSPCQAGDTGALTALMLTCAITVTRVSSKIMQRLSLPEGRKVKDLRKLSSDTLKAIYVLGSEDRKMN